MRTYPRGFFSLILMTFLLLAVSGALFAIPHLAERFRFDASLALSAGLLMKLHGAAALVITLAIGALLPVHIRSGWARRKNTASGLALLVLNSLLLLTAWGLYYLGDENWRQWTSDIHLIAGLVLAGVLIRHLVFARSLRAARRAV